MTRHVLLVLFATALLLLLASSSSAIPLFSSTRAAFAVRGGADDASPKKPHSKRKKRTKQASSKPPKTEDTTDTGKASSSQKNPILDEVLQTDDFYKVLGTTKEAIQASKDPDRAVQKAYRKRAVHTHPDKTGGNRAAFDKVAEAYEGLQDAEKRQLYDRYGKEGAKQYGAQGGGGASAEDLFRRFFGGRNPFEAFQQQQQQRGPAMYVYDVSLEALYHGLTRSVQLPDGQTVTVTVPAGAHDSDVLPGENNEDVCFRLRAAQHGHFVRKGHDLAVELRISLAESLTGAQRKIRHLNGQFLHVVSAAAAKGHQKKKNGDNDTPAPIRTGDVHVLKGYGMPKDATAKEHGDLYIQYEVVPVRSSSSNGGNTLTADERRELKRLLLKLEGKTAAKSSSEWPFTTADDTVLKLQPSSPSAFGSGYTRPRDPFANDFNPFGGGGFFFSQGF